MADYTDDDLQEVAGRVHDIACEMRCTPTVWDTNEARIILDAVAPAIVARAKAEARREVANELDRRAGAFRMLPGDKIRRQTHAEIAGWLRADQIERGQ